MFTYTKATKSMGKTTASKHQHWIKRWMHNSPGYQYSSQNEKRPPGFDPVSNILKFSQHAYGIKKYLSQGRPSIAMGLWVFNMQERLDGFTKAHPPEMSYVEI